MLQLLTQMESAVSEHFARFISWYTMVVYKHFSLDQRAGPTGRQCHPWSHTANMAKKVGCRWLELTANILVVYGLAALNKNTLFCFFFILLNDQRARLRLLKGLIRPTDRQLNRSAKECGCVAADWDIGIVLYRLSHLSTYDRKLSCAYCFDVNSLYLDKVLL